MERDKGFRILAIVALCIAVAGLSIGYAALSQDLTITGIATKAAGDWDVHFANLSSPTIVGTAAVESVANLNFTTLTVDVSVLKPGDSVSYTFDVVNDGNIDAKLSAVPIINGASAALEKNIHVTLTHADGSALVANEDLLFATGSNTTSLKLTITFDAASASVTNEEIDLPISTTLTYIQK